MKSKLCKSASRIDIAGPIGVFCAVLMLAGGVQAAEIGQVMFVKGIVHIVDPNGVRRAARQGDVLQGGERLVTESGALGQVKMLDGARIGLRPASDLSFAQTDTGTNSNVLALRDGSVRVLNMQTTLPGQSAPKPYVLQTGNAKVEIKQADTMALIRPLAAGTGDETVVALNSGSAVLTDSAGASTKVPVGQAARLVGKQGAQLGDAVELLSKPVISGEAPSSVDTKVAAGSSVRTIEPVSKKTILKPVGPPVIGKSSPGANPAPRSIVKFDSIQPRTGSLTGQKVQGAAKGVGPVVPTSQFVIATKSQAADTVRIKPPGQSHFFTPTQLINLPETPAPGKTAPPGVTDANRSALTIGQLGTNSKLKLTNTPEDNLGGLKLKK